LHTNQGRMNIN